MYEINLLGGSVMNFMTTVKNSLLEGFYPAGWDMAKMDACCEKGVQREAFWHGSYRRALQQIQGTVA